MKAIALRNNTTLFITKGKEYTVWIFRSGEIVTTVNDVGDNVIMSKYDFMEV